VSLTYLAVSLPVAVVNLPDHFRPGAGHQLAHFEELQNRIIVQNILGASSMLELGKHGRRWHLLLQIPLRTTLALATQVESRARSLRARMAISASGGGHSITGGKPSCTQSATTCNKERHAHSYIALFKISHDADGLFSKWTSHSLNKFYSVLGPMGFKYKNGNIKKFATLEIINYK